MHGLYSFNTPERLFQRLQRSFATFCKSPSEDGLWDVLFPMYHLREWIYPDGHTTYAQKADVDLTREQRLHRDIYALNEYTVIREFCNRAKHFNAKEEIGSVASYSGARVGWMRCGDSLGVTHFTVNGREIRSYLFPVMQAYVHYFHPEAP